MNYRPGDEDMEEDGREEEEELPQQVAELAQASVPDSMRGIRACKRCGILKTLDQFVREGCENCPFLDMVSASCGLDPVHCDILAHRSSNHATPTFVLFSSYATSTTQKYLIG